MYTLAETTCCMSGEIHEVQYLILLATEANESQSQLCEAR